MAIETLRHSDVEPAHPGEMLGEISIPATGRSKTEIARLLGLSRQTLYDIINARQPITPAVAVRIGKLFGEDPAVWLRMQMAHDLWRARREVDVSAIPTIQAAE